MEPETTENSVRFPYLMIAVSFILLVGIYLFLSSSLQDSLSDAVRETTEKANATVTRIFINEVYPDLEQALQLTYDRQKTKDVLTAQELEDVDNRVRQFMLGTDILKAKIYNVNGITIYSSEASQIGETKNDNPGFKQAMRGSAVSQVTYRDKFSSFDGHVFDRNLIASYVPVFGENRQIIGVAELYTDRSASIQFVDQILTRHKAMMVPALALILFLMAMISWRIFHVSTRSHMDTLDRMNR